MFTVHTSNVFSIIINNYWIKKYIRRCIVVKKRINNEWRNNFKLYEENDRKYVGKCIWKNR